MVVHGQIMLNQFQNFPVKAVQKSAFAATLKARMELRRHAKLYIKPTRTGKGRGANSNPMRDRASVRAKPMTATATVMVRNIWQSYFPSAPPNAGVPRRSAHHPTCCLHRPSDLVKAGIQRHECVQASRPLSAQQHAG